ncbi:hypothetical protein NEOKW01_0133 [Nematocida sp. AWRm80]|nr:hypothetical protein NEOKW01_0133 [Nematocida sp. AWRm80]
MANKSKQIMEPKSPGQSKQAKGQKANPSRETTPAQPITVHATKMTLYPSFQSPEPTQQNPNPGYLLFSRQVRLPSESVSNEITICNLKDIFTCDHLRYPNLTELEIVAGPKDWKASITYIETLLATPLKLDIFPLLRTITVVCLPIEAAPWLFKPSVVDEFKHKHTFDIIPGHPYTPPAKMTTAHSPSPKKDTSPTSQPHHSVSPQPIRAQTESPVPGPSHSTA